jgi:hypothetical protein
MPSPRPSSARSEALTCCQQDDRAVTGFCEVRVEGGARRPVRLPVDVDSLIGRCARSAVDGVIAVAIEGPQMGDADMVFKVGNTRIRL